MRRGIFALLLTCLLTACASLPRDALQVSLADITIVEAGLIEQRYAFKLRFMNAGESEIVLDGLSYELEINGLPFARGVSDKAVTIPRFGERVLDVTAVGNLAGILRQVAEMQSGGLRVEYRLIGRAGSRSSLGGFPFDVRGNLSLPKALTDPR
jgi:LEA14-like dessication related protein